MTPVLQFDGLSKRFPGVQALDGVSFEIHAGECHAIVGENGAGKSTLGKIVAGIYRPDAGRLLLDGNPVNFRSPLDAAKAGIRIVHQELATCPNLSVAENLCLGEFPSGRGRVHWRDMGERAKLMLHTVDLHIDPWTPMSSLSMGQEQLCQIAVAINRDARVLVMDEPTSSLSAGETQTLYAILDRMRRKGVTVVYVSHRLEEIVRLCDRVTVLRDGRFIETLVTKETTTGHMVQLMVGRSIEDYFPRHASRPPGETLLSVERLGGPGGFDDVTFELRAGEIVGLAGLVGAGRSEVARAIMGIDPISTGVVKLDGREVDIRSPRDAIDSGIGLLPEDRKRQGLVLSMNCRENTTLAILRELRSVPPLRGTTNSTNAGGSDTGQTQTAQIAPTTRAEPRNDENPSQDHISSSPTEGERYGKPAIRLRKSHERALTKDYFERLRVKAPHVDADIAGLSGGNQQKIALAKWLARQCRVLILDEPTRGVDVGAKADMHELIDHLAARGCAILLISSDLPEVLNLSTRVLVMAGGRIAGELARKDATQERALRLMSGMTADVA